MLSALLLLVGRNMEMARDGRQLGWNDVREKVVEDRLDFNGFNFHRQSRRLKLPSSHNHPTKLSSLRQFSTQTSIKPPQRFPMKINR
jgi:hypothetical protein